MASLSDLNGREKLFLWRSQPFKHMTLGGDMRRPLFCTCGFQKNGTGKKEPFSVYYVWDTRRQGTRENRGNLKGVLLTPLLPSAASERRFPHFFFAMRGDKREEKKEGLDCSHGKRQSSSSLSLNITGEKALAELINPISSFPFILLISCGNNLSASAEKQARLASFSRKKAR